MTQKQCLDQVFISSNQYETAINLDVGKILTYINWARRKVARDTFPYRLEWYVVRSIDIIGGPELSISMLGGYVIRISCTNPDDSTQVIARYAGTPKEFWFLQKANHPARATNSRPIFMIGDHTTNLRHVTIAPSTIVAATADIYQLPADLATDGTDYNTDLGVPPGYEPTVILATLAKCYQMISESDKMVRAVKQYEADIKGLEPEEYTRKIQYRNNLRALPPVEQQGAPQ